MSSIMRSAAMGAVALCALLGVSAVSSASADVIPYPTPGVVNPFISTFTATSTGDLSAYFYGTGASYDERLGVLINGVDSGVVGLQNHNSSFGDKLDFGSVTAGEKLTFYIIVDSIGKTYYSDPSLNPGKVNQVYSSTYSGGGGIPKGTYVGFEDLNPFDNGSSDFNYTDEQFVFTNTTAMSSVPLPAAAPMFGAALVVLGVAGYGLNRSRKSAASA